MIYIHKNNINKQKKKFSNKPKVYCVNVDWLKTLQKNDEIDDYIREWVGVDASTPLRVALKMYIPNLVKTSNALKHEILLLTIKLKLKSKCSSEDKINNFTSI